MKYQKASLLLLKVRTMNNKNEIVQPEELVEKKKNLYSWILSLPSLIWLMSFFLVPYLIIVLCSVLKPSIYDIEYIFTLNAYKALINMDFLKSFLLSFRLAIVTTFICLMLSYPVAYFIARSTEKLKNILLMLIIIPFWTNFIIRIFSWRIFLSQDGVLNQFLMTLHVINQPLHIIRTDIAVVLVMVYVYLPYMILPLYSVIEKLDFTLLDAAMDLGANRMKAFLKVTLPLSMQGIWAGSILVFIPALGAYIIPQLVGNQNSLYIGQIITYKIKNIPRDWPLASALSLVLLIIISILLMIFYYIFIIRKKK